MLIHNSLCSISLTRFPARILIPRFVSNVNDFYLVDGFNLFEL